MKNFVVSLTILSFSWTAYCENGDIPPPPMPSYMKKKPQDTSHVYSSSKAQKELDKVEREPSNAKFLRKNEPNIRKFVKSEPTIPAPVAAVDPVDQEEVKDEFLEDVDNEDTYTADQKPVRVNGYDEETPAPSPAPLAKDLPQEVKAVYPNQNDQPKNEVVPTAALPEAPYDPLESETTGLEQESQADQLMVVEEELEASGEVIEANLRNPRKPTSSSVFKPGMYKFSKDCAMKSEASSSSDDAGTIKLGRKLWIGSHDEDWHKVYKKDGAAFISADCLK